MRAVTTLIPIMASLREIRYKKADVPGPESFRPLLRSVAFASYPCRYPYPYPIRSVRVCCSSGEGFPPARRHTAAAASSGRRTARLHAPPRLRRLVQHQVRHGARRVRSDGEEEEEEEFRPAVVAIAV